MPARGGAGGIAHVRRSEKTGAIPRPGTPQGAGSPEEADRRDEIRFELTKEDRRSGKDRRKRSGWDTIR